MVVDVFVMILAAVVVWALGQRSGAVGERKKQREVYDETKKRIDNVKRAADGDDVAGRLRDHAKRR